MPTTKDASFTGRISDSVLRQLVEKHFSWQSAHGRFTLTVVINEGQLTAFRPVNAFDFESTLNLPLRLCRYHGLSVKTVSPCVLFNAE